jgi:hypothetical protein
VAKRGAILGLGLSLFACKMDNPAFDLESGAELADESRGTDSTDPTDPTDQGESDEAPGDGDGEPSESSTDDPTDPTEGECTPGTSCGPCKICDETSECVIDVGGPCDGPTLHCADYLFGASESSCYRLTDVELVGRCSEQGTCESSKPSECPLEKGALHFACDGACVTNVEGCSPYAAASEVEMSAMCSVNGESTAMCTSKCTDGIQAVVQDFGCVTGECAPLGEAALCGPYACDEQEVACLESCETVSDCNEQFTCVDLQCVPG